MPLNIIILAAGMGKRLKTNMCKVVVPLIHKPLIIHLMDNLGKSMSPDKTVVIIGHHGEDVKTVVNKHYNGVNFAWQKEQKGTGHAVMQAESFIKDLDRPTLILAGDVPLVNETMIASFLEFHETRKTDITVLTTTLPDPTGYGRIIRDKNQNNIERIVEQKDASEMEQLVDEINSGIYLVNSKLLFKLLKEIKPNNTQNEYYLTDIITIGIRKQLNVQAYLFKESDLLRGVNSREDLSKLANYIYTQSIRKHLENGVTLLSPKTTFIEPDVIIENDVIIDPCVTLKGKTILKEGTHVSSFGYLSNYISKPGEIIPPHFKNV
jgi:bifunctional UDP-N-acetylglucosamine pyrophosphorylase/glucosamine-1-phosphate N-acetyltransferase